MSYAIYSFLAAANVVCTALNVWVEAYALATFTGGCALMMMVGMLKEPQ